MTTDGRIPVRQIDPTGGAAIQVPAVSADGLTVEWVDQSGGSGGVVAGATTKYTATATTTISNTTGADIPGLAGNLVSDGPDDVFLINVGLDINGGSATNVLIIEVLVDATALGEQLTARHTIRQSANKTFRVTGLAAGSHPFKVRSRLDAGTTAFTIYLTHSTVIVTKFGGTASGIDGGGPSETYLDFIDGGIP